MTSTRNSSAQTRARFTALALVLFVFGACHKSDDTTSDAAIPPRGDVWEVTGATDRATTPAAVLAYVNGIHELVLDGDDAYAGMRRFSAKPGSDGARRIDLGNGLEGRLVPASDTTLTLTFSSGETIEMHKKEVKDE